MRANTYEKATKRPSYDVWPGCGDGRKRWCGRVHDFSFRQHVNALTTHDFRCWMNHERGCPQPKPKVGETLDQYEKRTGR